jgi:hypothetical protein
VQIPGKVLTPGTYVFRLLNSASNRNIVEIYSEDANGNQTFVTVSLRKSDCSGLKTIWVDRI